MSRVLFDHNVPAPLRRYLMGHQVRTADQEGWGQISNGALISFAENAGYEALLTCDQNLGYQQNLSSRKISLVVLGSNIWPGVKPVALSIADAVSRALPGFRIHRDHFSAQVKPVVSRAKSESYARLGFRVHATDRNPAHLLSRSFQEIACLKKFRTCFRR